ncbi:MAG TPA: hypothetical protein VN843_21680 [Anaerolineales bacterium]|nr:hypothetical protein [Anaerolineales bacterium]
MSEDKPTTLDYIKGFTLLAVLVIVYTAVSNFVLEKFWSLVIKLILKKFPEDD